MNTKRKASLNGTAVCGLNQQDLQVFGRSWPRMMIALFGMLITPVSVAQAWAQEICDTPEECLKLEFDLSRRIHALKTELESEMQIDSSAAPELTEVAKRADGTARLMNLGEADRYCQRQGMRLPTARDLGLFAQSRGAFKLLHTQYPGVSADEDHEEVLTEIHSNRKLRYEPVFASGISNPIEVDFYYDLDRAFSGSGGDWGEAHLWSSSKDPLKKGNGYYYRLNRNAGFESVEMWVPAAVRCVK